MRKFIGTKIIKAQPQTCQKDIHNSKQGDPGYLVEYKDGYQAWSPKDAFEEAYRRVNGMSFGLAIEAMKKGEAVKLPMWSKDVSIKIQFPDDHSKMTAPYFYVTSRFGLVPWIPTMIEMLSDDWIIID